MMDILFLTGHRCCKLVWLILLQVLALFYSATASANQGAALSEQNPDPTESLGHIRPNILFFLIDDQRNDTLGCAGHPIIKTPVIDSLAAGGVRFENAFVTTSICAASRASILTGLHERTHGYTFKKPPLKKSYMLDSYPTVLRRAGYRSGYIGKYGVQTQGQPEAEMFDVFEQLSRKPYFKEMPNGSYRHVTEITGDRAIEFLKTHSGDQPFCLSVSFNAVHAEDSDLENHYPWPKAVDGMYEDVEIPAPRLSDPAIFANHPDFLKNSLNRKRYFWRWDTPEKYQKNMGAYFRMISGVDRVMGRVRGELTRLGLADNTVIIVTSDNGYYMGDRGFAGKWSHYDQSLRVPLIIYDPRLSKEQQGRVEDKMALNIDLPYTLLALAGEEAPEHYQGSNLLPIVRGESVESWRGDFFCEHLMENKDLPKWEGVRGERYMYARYFEQEPIYEFLHDLKTDPDQIVNLATDAAYLKVLKEQRFKCDKLRELYQK